MKSILAVTLTFIALCLAAVGYKAWTSRDRSVQTDSTHLHQLHQAQEREDSLRQWFDDATRSDSIQTHAYLAWVLAASKDSLQREADRRVAAAWRSAKARYGADTGFASMVDSATTDTTCKITLRCVDAGILFAGDSSKTTALDSAHTASRLQVTACTTKVAQARVAQDSAVSAAIASRPSLWRWILSLFLGFTFFEFGRSL